MSEVIDRYQGLADAFGARVEAARDDQWSSQSPCDEWKARDVVKHIVESQRSIVAGLAGTEPQPVDTDADPKELYRDSYAAVRKALAVPDALEKQVPSPMGPMALEIFLGRLASMDMLVHTWDLARAVGGDEVLDQDAVQHAFEGIQPMDAMIRRPGVMGAKVEPADGADVQTQFLNFLGRTV